MQIILGSVPTVLEMSFSRQLIRNLQRGFFFFAQPIQQGKDEFLSLELFLAYQARKLLEMFSLKTPKKHTILSGSSSQNAFIQTSIQCCISTLNSLADLLEDR